jgi:hypothetical protein
VIRTGVWLATGTAVAAPYPCRCPESRNRWKCAAPDGGWPENVCPCRGRTDVLTDAVPPDCCAWRWPWLWHTLMLETQSPIV